MPDVSEVALASAHQANFVSWQTTAWFVRAAALHVAERIGGGIGSDWPQPGLSDSKEVKFEAGGLLRESPCAIASGGPMSGHNQLTRR